MGQVYGLNKILSKQGIVNLSGVNYPSTKSPNDNGLLNNIVTNYGLTLIGDNFSAWVNNTAIGNTERILTLSNDNYITLTIESVNWFRIKLYDKNNQLLLEPYNVNIGISNLKTLTNGLTMFAGVDDTTNYKTVGFILTATDQGVDIAIFASVSLNASNTAKVDTFLYGSVLTENPYQTAPESIPDGGFGDFDYKSDTVPLPSTPTISVSDSGFVTLYKPSLAQLQALSAYMWSGLFDITTFRKIFADPMDCIISLSLIPVNPTASSSQELKVGNVGTGLTFDKLPTQFVEVNFNSINIGRRANNFMDYSPYTKLQIYLPFIGTRSLSIDDIAGKNVSLKYIIDIFTGACNASIGVEVEDRDGSQKTTCLYQFTGNVLANVPVTANNFASFLQATVGAVSTAVGVATGAGALAGVASAINASQSMKPDIEKSGNLSSTAGFLGVQKPYLILTYPNLCRPEGRDKVTGTPSFLGLSSSKKLSSFHGYTQLHRVNVQGISCTETERQMILSQLTGEGVILP